MLSSPMMKLDIWLVKHVGFSLLTWMHAAQTGIATRPALLLTTIGAKSSQARDVVLPYFEFGDEYVVIGSKGGAPQDPAWVNNIRANPLVTIHVERRKFPAIARFADPELRDVLYKRAARDVPSYAEYQARTARIIPVLLVRPT
jgi:deazaflavin-dependent oxidoreductase (nitroreductase family)